MSSKIGSSSIRTIGASSTATGKSNDESIPIISRSVISLGSEQGADNVTRFEIVPSPPDEHPFLLLEPACYIGPQAQPEPEYRERFISSKSRLLTTMTLEELRHRILTVGIRESDKMTILDDMFPPRIFCADGKRWKVNVSKVPAGPEDRLKLFQRYDSLRLDRNASDQAYCPIMNNLIHSLFDECLRQEVLACPERAVLITNIRNGLNRITMTLEALYEGSQLKTMRTTTALNARKQDLVVKVDEQAMKIQSLEAEIEATKLKIKKAHVRNEEQLKKIRSKHQDEFDYHKKIATLAKGLCENADTLSPVPSGPGIVKKEKQSRASTKVSAAHTVVFTASRH